MAFRSPFSPKTIEKVRANQYHQALKSMLKKQLKDGDAVSFYLILNYIYDKWDKSKSAKLPFLVLVQKGKDNEAWKKYGATVVEGSKKQKDFMVVGILRRSKNDFMLEINKSRGLNKIPKTVLTRLDALFANVNKDFKLHTRELAVQDTEENTTEEQGTGTTTEPAQPTQPNVDVSEEKKPMTEAKKAKIIALFKTKKQDEAKELDASFKLFRKKTRPGLKNIGKHIKRGATTKRDLALLKEVNQIYSTTVKLYNQSPAQIQEKFKAPYAALLLQKEELYKLSLATKQKQKSVSASLADNYYSKRNKRVASKEEVEEINQLLKDALATDKKRPKNKKAGQKLLLEAAFYVLKKTGTKNFKLKYVNQIAQKQMRKKRS